MNNSFVNQPAQQNGPVVQYRTGNTPGAPVSNRHKSWFQKIRWMALGCLILLGISSKGQLYPVTLSVTGDYSFSGSIADIANGTVGNFAANIVTNDMTVSSREVFLKITIEGMGINAETSTEWHIKTPISITWDVQLDKYALKDYFKHENLTGISEQQFDNLLPEGTYTFTFGVYDYNNLTTAISNKVFFNVRILHGTAPEVISPACGSVLGRLQTIPIVWSPAVARGFNITYEIEYVIDDHNILSEGDYQTALETTTTKKTEIMGNAYSFIPDNELVEQPFRFIYRVKAIAKTIPDQIEVPVIADDGYSEICSFDYKPDVQAEPCTEISSVVVDQNNSGSTFANIIWTVKSSTEVEGQKYTLTFKPVAMPGISPCEIPNITAKNCKINDLTSGITYRFTVTSECNSVLSEMYVDYTMPKAVNPIASCGEKAPFDPVNASNLLPLLKNGDVIYLKDVPIVIGNLPVDVAKLVEEAYRDNPQRNEADGSFNGCGRITFTIPLFQEYTPGVAVKFKNLFIDKDYKVIAGYVETLYDPGNWEKHIANMNIFDKGGKLFEKIMTDGFEPNMTLDGVIGDTVNIKVSPKPNPTKVTIDYKVPSPTTGAEGEIKLAEIGSPAGVDGSSYYIILDADKVYYGIDVTTGTIIPIGRYNPDINDILAKIDRNVIDIEPSITFENGSGATFAFDPANPVYNSNLLFQKPYVLEGSPEYPLRWKFLPTGSGMDKVVARVPAEIDRANLKFIVTSNNTEIDFDKTSTSETIELNLMPASSDAVYSVHAVVKVGDDWEQAGRFDVFTRTAKNYSVTLVPMGGSVPLKEDVKTALDAIWSRYGITWTVDVDEDFYVDERIETIDNIIGTSLETDADAFLSEYTPKQLAVNRAYRDYLVASEKYSKETMYVFVLPTGKSPKSGQLGDMPLGKQWGYLFGAADAHTLAHELGHGKTKLDHTFYDGNIAQNSTANLMDYTGGTDLVRCQWEFIHTPAVFDPVQDDEDGALYVISESDELIKYLNEIICANQSNESYATFTNKIPQATGMYRRSTIDFNGIEVILDRENLPGYNEEVQLSVKDPEIIEGNYYQITYKCKSSSATFQFIVEKSKWAQFYVLIKGAQVDYFNDLVDNIPETESQRAYSLLAQLPDCAYPKISVANRKKYLSWLAGETWTNTDQELMIIKLIETIQTQQEAQLIIKYLEEEKDLLAELKTSIDGDNLLLYYKSLSKLLTQSIGKESLKNSILEFEQKTSGFYVNSLDGWAAENVFFWFNPTLVERILNGNHTILYYDYAINEHGVVNFTIEEVRGFPIFPSWVKFLVELNPFELVRIDFKTASDVLDTEEGKILYIPAVTISLLIQEQWKQEMVDAVNLGLIIGGGGIITTSGRTAIILKSILQAIPEEVSLVLSYLKITPTSFVTLFLADVGIQIATNYLIEEDWNIALGRIDIFDAVFSGVVGNISSLSLKANQIANMSLYGKQFSLCRRLTQESTKVVLIEFTKISFDYRAADTQLKTLCNNNESYYQTMSKLILALSVKYSADEIHSFLKGWNSKVAESLEKEFDQIAKPILLEINEIVQTDNFQKIIKIGTKVIAMYIQNLKNETVNVEVEIDDIKTLQLSIPEIKEIEKDNTNVVLPIIQ